MTLPSNRPLPFFGRFNVFDLCGTVEETAKRARVCVFSLEGCANTLPVSPVLGSRCRPTVCVLRERKIGYRRDTCQRRSDSRNNNVTEFHAQGETARNLSKQKEKEVIRSGPFRAYGGEVPFRVILAADAPASLKERTSALRTCSPRRQRSNSEPSSLIHEGWCSFCVSVSRSNNRRRNDLPVSTMRES